MSSQPRDLVFISYAHEDSTWLERLQKFLKPWVKQGALQIWADKCIPTGDQWRQDINVVLNRTAVGVLLVSADSLASDFIMDVELPALLEAERHGLLTLFCIPVSASPYRATVLRDYQWAWSPDEPLDSLEVYRRNQILVEITDKLVEAAQGRMACVEPAPDTSTRTAAAREPVIPITVASSSQLGALYNIPDLPPHYLPRQEDLSRLKQALLCGTLRTVGITGMGFNLDLHPKLGLHGQGGIGKSVLAAALARDEEVRQAFPEGVFWITLGQEPDVLRVQSDLLRALGEESAGVTNAEDGRRALRQVLADRGCLVVVDDAWDAQHARAFDVLGPRSRLVITTRDGAILTALGAQEESIQRLPEAHALQLLASWVEQDRDDLPKSARGVARECGYLPLALSVAGALVKDGLTWNDLLGALERGRLEFLDHPYASVFRSMRLGVDALTPDERQRYLELAVFPEVVRVPDIVAVKLWRKTGDLDSAASKALLAKFERRALLDRSGPDAQRTIAFHDLQHDFLRILAEDIAACHNALLDAFAEEFPNESEGGVAWHAMPEDESYLWIHLGEHLIAANRSKEFGDLLFDYRWLEAKMYAAGLPALLSDLDAFPHDSDVALLARTLRLSAPVLTANPDQFPSQLLGRLLGLDRPQIQAMIGTIRPLRKQPWLRPRTGSLNAPTGGPMRSREGHSGWVNSVAVTADRRRAVSGSDDMMLKVWDLESGRELRTLRGHSGWINSLAITADGRRAVSGSDDKTLKVWDLESGRELRTLCGHSGWVLSVAVTADGRRAVSGSHDKTLKVWDLDSGRELRTLHGHSGWVNSLAITADGRRAVSGSYDETVTVWDLESGRELCTLHGHAGRVNSLAITADGRQAVSGSDDKTLKVWDLESGRELRTLHGHSGWVNSLAITADERRAASGADDKTLKVWDLESGTVIASFSADASVHCCAIAPDGVTFVAGDALGRVHFLRLEGADPAPQP